MSAPSAPAAFRRKGGLEECARRALRMIRSGKSLQEAARAFNVSVRTVREWLSGRPQALRRHKAEAAAANARLAARLAELRKSPDAGKHCGVTGKPCPKAYRCCYGADGAFAHGSEDTRIEMCFHAISNAVGDCRSCRYYGAECLDAWRCWKMEIGELDSEMCGHMRSMSRPPALEVSHGAYGIVRSARPVY